MKNLGIALSWKYPGVSGIMTADNELTAWPAVLGPPPTEAELVAIDDEYQADAVPLIEWEKIMAKSDKEDISREMEDHIHDHHGSVAGNVFQQAKYDAKKAKRTAKPT